MISTASPSSSSWDSAHSSPKRSTASSPSSRRAVWTRCSKRFIATWRKTVAIAPSIGSASSASRDSGVSACSSRRPKTIVSPNTLAVSASVSGVAMWKMPWRAAERRVDAVAELVRERQHVAAACRCS